MFETVIYLPFAASLIFGILLLLNCTNNTRPQNIHAGIMMLMSLMLFILATLMHGVGNPHTYYVLDIVYSYVGLAVFPLICLYYKSLTDNSKFGIKYYIVFLPTLLIGTANVLVYLMMGHENSINYLNAYLADTPTSPFFISREFSAYINSSHTHFSIMFWHWKSCFLLFTEFIKD